MDSCIHPECNNVAKMANLLFDGAPMRMVDLSEDTPGALPYGVTCSVQPVAGFQIQDPRNVQIENPETGEITEVPDSGQWFQVHIWAIRSPDTARALNEHAARVYAQPDPEEQPPPGPEQDQEEQ
jgi:hypothetical protein